MGSIKFLSKNGDDETNWEDAASTLTAEKVFESYLNAGCAAFKKTGDGTYKQVRNFDSNVNEYIVTRPLMGG